MGDNEIIKALECCRFAVAKTDCNSCPYAECTSNKGCNGETVEDALDLINRQKVAIENLSHNNGTMTNSIRKLQKELEQANAEVELLHSDYTYKFVKAKAKAEAYKEFAEMLCEDRVSNDPVVIAARCLLKELEGEQ